MQYFKLPKFSINKLQIPKYEITIILDWKTILKIPILDLFCTYLNSKDIYIKYIKGIQFPLPESLPAPLACWWY